MNKSEIASYLVSLHTLLEAQTKGQRSIASMTLANEYEKHWGMLKEIIQKENENEARSSERDRPRWSEDATNLQSSQSKGGSRDRERSSQVSGAGLRRPGISGSDEGGDFA